MNECLLGRKSDAVSSILYDFFTNSESPYEAALIAMLNSGDFYTSKQSSLSYHIMEQFIIWKQTFPVRVPPLSIDLKLTAFKLVMKQKNNGLNKLVAKAFEMKNDKDSFIDEIHALVRRKLYKEVRILNQTFLTSFFVLVISKYTLLVMIINWLKKCCFRHVKWLLFWNCIIILILKNL